jgi:hypothetical protein
MAGLAAYERQQDRYGNSETWGPYLGHPNDPRYDDSFDEMVEEEKFYLLGTLKFDDRDADNISFAVSEILWNVDLAREMNLSMERKDLLGAIATADFSAMGDAIRCISRDYWEIRAEMQAIENVRNELEKSNQDFYCYND